MKNLRYRVRHLGLAIGGVLIVASGCLRSQPDAPDVDDPTDGGAPPPVDAGVGPDDDGDSIVNGADNCVSVANPDQADTDGDGAGDACDNDSDGDDKPDTTDNCPGVANADQADGDGDMVGDACDNCPTVPNTDQRNDDGDADSQGNVCDDDIDNDLVRDADDNCPYDANPDQADMDSDGFGNACEGNTFGEACGDGYKTGSEECDDGVDTLASGEVGPRSGDGCSEDCKIEPGWSCGPDGVSVCTTRCGDGIRAGDEKCDPGTTPPNIGCTADCTARPGYLCPTVGLCETTCGDGVRVGSEQCDDGNFSSGDGCSFPGCAIEAGGILDVFACGDGLKRENEACDDGNTRAGDGCAQCVVEPSYACVGTAPSICDGIRGDGIVSGTERCDDGKHCSDGAACATDAQCETGSCIARSNDGCDADGQVELGWRCTTPGQACVRANNNGVLDPGEQCDDNNNDAGDGCTDGAVDFGYECSLPPSTCGPKPGYSCTGTANTGAACEPAPIIGDGEIVPGEQCDDGNAVAGDGCSDEGQEELGYTCKAAGEPCTAIVGDRRIAGDEECDDGNAASGDGCSSAGQLEDGWVCVDEDTGTTCIELIGDGIRVGTEECDDGNTANNDGCSLGYIDPYFTCPVDGQPCVVKNNDGQVGPGELCDDGNDVDNDGCTDGAITPGYACQNPTNGPSVCGADIEGGYACTGPEQTGIACDPKPVHGDGILAGNEACDTGSATDPACVAGVVTYGYVCTAAEPSVCAPNYGDGYVVVGVEACDDGNLNNGDGCSNVGAVELGYVCPTAGQACQTEVGDGIVAGLEACDDGNTNNNDGCSSLAQVETGFSCAPNGTGSTCTPIHGDGLIVGNEACDDKNLQGGDGCTAGVVNVGWLCPYDVALARSVCDPILGDGIVIAGIEECDDGNILNNDGCSSAGELEDGFDCDNFDNAPTDCASICGDGKIVGQEACDQLNNTVGNDGCEATCAAVTVGWSCTGAPSQCAVVQNDGIVVAPEQCDDNNNVAGDGCYNGVVEPGFICTHTPTTASVCTADTGGGYICTGVPNGVGAACQPAPVCGDGRIVGNEGCDDGNATANDGCSSTCVLENGFACTNNAANNPATTCAVICGDGLLRGQEQCDDNNQVNNDGCSNACVEEQGFDCLNTNADTPSDCDPILNDGLIRGNEQCDDGNTVIAATDGCHNGVQDDKFNCAGQPSTCTPKCGDGFKVGNEVCDDGNTNNNDGCQSTCLAVTNGYICTGAGANSCIPDCGDGQKVGNEVCDDGNENNGDGCEGNCLAETDGYNCVGTGANSCQAQCGDGFVVTGKETCDDGNTNNNDGCSATCAVENGYTCAGGTNPNGTVPSVCTTVCSDGLKRGAEQCDDGNANNGDGCTSACVVENGYVCNGEGVGSCQPQLKVFLSTNAYLAGGAKRYANIQADCKAERGDTAFFCSKADVQTRANAGQVHPSVYGVTLWRSDQNSCNDLAYNSGHQFTAKYLVLNNNNTFTETNNANCINKNFRAACCLP